VQSRLALDHGQTHDHTHAHTDFQDGAPVHALGLGAHWLGALFADHSSESDCRLHDGLSATDVHLLANIIAIPSLLAIFYIAFSRITATARAAALYDARGPPATL
jgi:hypothetical protein